MELGTTLHAKTRAAWRRWLSKNHATAPEIWLIFYTKASGMPFVAYDAAVEEALCFGWIDSVVKKHGPESRAQRFTPRRPNSPISPLNRERVLRLIADGKMTDAGLKAAGDLTTSDKVPADILRRIKKDPETWRHFQSFSDSYKRIRVGWIDGARARPDVFKQRLDYFVKMTKQGKTFGTMP
jgi:uncharacterized protein YdeI (YjbR/CyaY-like superfamily)